VFARFGVPNLLRFSAFDYVTCISHQNCDIEACVWGMAESAKRKFEIEVKAHSDINRAYSGFGIKIFDVLHSLFRFWFVTNWSIAIPSIKAITFQVQYIRLSIKNGSHSYKAFHLNVKRLTKSWRLSKTKAIYNHHHSIIQWIGREVIC
jgi:hypothetical protein